jgi:hypothetical protein
LPWRIWATVVNLKRVRKAGKKVEKSLRKNNSDKSDETHPDPDWVSLFARSAFAECANGKLCKN